RCVQIRFKAIEKAPETVSLFYCGSWHRRVSNTFLWNMSKAAGRKRGSAAAAATTEQEKPPAPPPLLPNQADGNIDAERRLFERIYGIVALDPIPRPPRDHHLGETINEFQKYLNETRIEKTFLGLLRILLKKKMLPYNPYPLFLTNLYRFSEGRYLLSTPASEILPSFRMETEDTRIDYVYKSRHSSHIWGLPYLVQCCSPNDMKLYEWLGRDVVPPPSTTRSADTNYVIQPCVAMIGPAVFQGSFYQYVPIIQFRVEYRIMGPDMTHAIEVFINIVIKDLNHTEKESDHILLGVSLPVDPETEPMRYSSKFWQVDEINTRGDAFWDSMVEAVTNKKYVVAELVFRVDPKMGVYKRGRKQYSFNFVQRSYRNQDAEQLTPFSEMMEACLFEGIFMDHMHADSYISTFCPREELVDRDKNYRQEPPAPFIRKSLLRRGVKVEKDTHTDDRIRIDGFLIKGPIDFSPDSRKVIDPVRIAWERHIARSHFVPEAFDVVHHMILLMLLDRKSVSDEHFIQVHRFLRSSAARMHSLMMQNQFIREIIENFDRAEESQIVQRQFMEYRHGIKDLLDSVYRECSSEMITCGRAIETRLYDMSHSVEGKGSNIILSPKSVLDLRFINHYCYPIFLRLVEVMLPQVPLITAFVDKLRKAYPEEVLRFEDAMPNPNVEYGYEEPLISKQHHQFIDTELAEAECNESKEIVKETVLMQYLLDTRVDEVWEGFMMDILSSNTFPQNPYPRLITDFRRAALKMSLCYDTDEKIVKDLYHSEPQLLDSTTFVYQMPGSDAYGYKSSLYAIDTAAYFALSSFLFPLVHENFTEKRGVYRASVCTCTVGEVSTYGRLDPYLRQVQMADHVYIKGPVRCSREGMELFTHILTEYAMQLDREQDFVVMGIFLGSLSKRWSVKEISERKATFITEIERVLILKENIFLKLYAQYDWRYICVTKYFRYRYVSFDKTEYVKFFDEIPTEPYQSIFFDQEKAAFHFKRGGAHECCDPFIGPAIRQSMLYADAQIAECHRRQDFFGVHRWLLLKSLASKGGNNVAEGWRMMHSTASELNFLNCINKALQDLILYVLSDMTFAQTKDDEEPVDLYQYGIDEALFASTYAGYYHKLMEVLSNPLSFAPSSMSEFLRRKLNFISVQSYRGNCVLKIESQSIRVLEEVRQATMSVENAVAADMHQCCPEARESVAKILAQTAQKRPSAEERSDATVAVQVPKATAADHQNEWHQDLYNF
ncbi:hypothetical protein BOX15_Mlig004104g2, partial [Macrostomum lignano]